MQSTPDHYSSRRSQGTTTSSASPLAGSPFTSSTPTNRHSANASRRALAPQQQHHQQLGRVPGTPVGRLLKSEGVATSSPRRIRQRSWAAKARDWPSNALLSLETSFQLLSFDAAGYPLGAALNALHLIIRLPSLYAALPALSDLWPTYGTDTATASRYAARKLATADARLEALQRQAQFGTGRGGGGSAGWNAWARWISICLVLLSVANAVYLVTRRRKYQMVLRRDPLSSPNAKAAMLNFAPDRPAPTLAQKLRRHFLERIGWATPDQDNTTFPVQELNVWVPDHAIWSLRLFTLYSPPIAVLYHLLSPSNFVVSLLCGALFTAQMFALVYLYSNLVSDRAALQAEVMHEYNAKFVNPRVFVPKRDACVSTSEAEMVTARDWRARRPVGHFYGDEGAEVSHDAEEESEAVEEIVQRGSGRKVRRRQSEMPLRTTVFGAGDERYDPGSGTDSPVPASRSRKPRASMFG